MEIERVAYSPHQEVYHHGDVLTVAVYFSRPFVGQCEVGLARSSPTPPDGFYRQIFARSSDVLYEGQVRVREELDGPCLLWLVLTPVNGEAETIAATSRPLEVRPIRP